MRFLLLLEIDPGTDGPALANAEGLGAMIRFNRQLREAGVVVAADGLDGARLRFAQGRVDAIEGLYAGSASRIAAFWLIDVASRADALAWAGRAPVHDGEIEVREVLEVETLDQSLEPQTPPRESRFGDTGEFELAAGRPSGRW